MSKTSSVISQILHGTILSEAHQTEQLISHQAFLSEADQGFTFIKVDESYRFDVKEMRRLLDVHNTEDRYWREEGGLAQV
ncbi:hypothetical protein YC2023_023354 [Brassica napus]